MAAIALPQPWLLRIARSLAGIVSRPGGEARPVGAGAPSYREPRNRAQGDAIRDAGTPDPDERALVSNARSDPDAFAELYRRHVRAVHAFASRRTGSPQLADDITAAAFERALRNLDTFVWRGGGFGAWLHRIAANCIIDHYRHETADARRAERCASELARTESEPGEPTFDGADVARVRAALAHLRPRYQEVVSLRYLSGLDADAAAAALGCSKSVLAVTLHRALRALERLMREGDTA